MNQYSAKSFTILLVLWFFFGSYSVHDFYAGRVVRGVLKLLLLFVVPLILITITVNTILSITTEFSFTAFVTTMTTYFILLVVGAILLFIASIINLVDFIMIVTGNFKDSMGLKIVTESTKMKNGYYNKTGGSNPDSYNDGYSDRY
jgi:TM2 domain-containing membrane protein YozV